MLKYYTRACNFYYGKQAVNLIKKKLALPLCGNQNIAFNTLEIFIRHNNKINSKFIKLNDIKKQNKLLKAKITKYIKNICSKRKNFLKNVNFSDIGHGILMNQIHFFRLRQLKKNRSFKIKK